MPYKIWSYSPDAKIKYKNGIISTIFWTTIVPVVGFLLCKWGIETGEISMEIIFFIGLFAFIMPIQIVLSSVSTIKKERLKSLYIFVMDAEGCLYYFYLSSDRFLDTAKLRKYQIDTIRYRNLIYATIRDYLNEQNRIELLKATQQDMIIPKIFEQHLQDSVGYRILNVTELTKNKNRIIVKCQIGSLENVKTKTLFIYDVINDFEGLVDVLKNYNKTLTI